MSTFPNQMITALIWAILAAASVSCHQKESPVCYRQDFHIFPVLKGKTDNPVLEVEFPGDSILSLGQLRQVTFLLEGTDPGKDVARARLFISSGAFCTQHTLGECQIRGHRVTFNQAADLRGGSRIWLSLELSPKADIDHKVRATCVSVILDSGKARDLTLESGPYLRLGLALRQQGDDGVAAFRIPGLTTSRDGTLLAIYDARKDSDRDLQGDIDICMNRSTDGGKSWMPMQTVLDMGSWGGLPEKYNGVSDACILSDSRTGELFVFGTWMHGVLDPKDGHWIEGLNADSTVWNHQWRAYGSQPGFGVRESAQMVMARSQDDGRTWSTPENLTGMLKQEAWWLMAPAPGRGITTRDGTLVIPAQGRDQTGMPFSLITYSLDHGKTWSVSQTAYSNTNECAVIERKDGSLMLNMRFRPGHARAVSTTRDLGDTWTEHATSRSALREPVCMASLLSLDQGTGTDLTLFSNPDSPRLRDHMTIKVSLDGGESWQEALSLLLDEGQGRGYSCLTQIDRNTVGILYEGSGADMTFQRIPISELLDSSLR